MAKNVILLTIDALSSGHVGHLGYDRQTTPRLDELATRGLSGSLCVAQSSHTRESMPSLFASAYPSQLGGVGAIPSSRPTLATVLSDAGFETAGFHSNPYLSRAYDFDRGFDIFDDALPLARNRVMTFLHRALNHFRTQPYTRGEDLNEKGRSWLDDTVATRRFLWLHYMDPHGPYQPPAADQQVFREEVVGARRAKDLWRRTVDEPEAISATERATLVDLYDAEIRYVDRMVGEFLDSLAERGLLADSVVVIAADHGDAFGQHGVYGHPRRLYEELIQVPLVILLPDDRMGRIDSPVENVDLAPTVLDALDIPRPDEFVGESLIDEELWSETDGVSATSPGRERREAPDVSRLELTDVAVAEATGEGAEAGRRRTAIRTSRYKLHIEHDVETGKIDTTELYDVAEDPREESELGEEAEPVRDALESLYRTHCERVATDESATGTDADTVDDIVTERLEDLGYR